jgi:hypothetical protein
MIGKGIIEKRWALNQFVASFLENWSIDPFKSEESK